MRDLSFRTLSVLAVALLVPAVASVWLMAVPGSMTSSAYALVATLLVALASVTLGTNDRAPRLRRVN